MPIPAGLRAVDLMVEIPRKKASFALASAESLMKDAGSKEYQHHPAEYLFKEAGTNIVKDDMEASDLVEMMDAHGVETGCIVMSARKPERQLAIFDQYPGRFIGEVIVDPNDVMGTVRDLKRIVPMHPNVVAASAGPCLYNPQVAIDDKKMYPIYAACVELDIPIMVLTGVPGPRVPFKCQTPDLFDVVCYDFPELKIVMRHCGEPWVDLCVKLLLKWPNLFYSTSAFAPRHYPREIIEFANTRGADKVMFAGYYPGLSMERVERELQELPLKDEVWPKFLRDNARRVFKLDAIMDNH